MQVGKVRMRVRQRRVPVRMDVRLAAVPRKVVHVPVMLVMRMRMRVIRGRMDVTMRMPFGEMQRNARGHQPERRPE